MSTTIFVVGHLFDIYRHIMTVNRKGV